MRATRMFVAICLFLTLSSCSPPDYVIRPAIEGGRITFYPVGDKGLFSWGRDAIWFNFLVVRSRTKILWVIQRDERKADCKGEGSNPYPVRYGKVPACFAELSAPAELPKGEWLNVTADGLRWGESTFRLVQAIQSRSWSELDRGVRWPEAMRSQQLYPSYAK